MSKEEFELASKLNSYSEEEIERYFGWMEPSRIKKRLIHAAFFLLTFEIFRSDVVDKTRDFFMGGFDEEGFTYSTECRARVLSKAKKPFEASLLWLVEVCALDHADVGDIMKLIEYRNNIAHQLGALLTGFEVQFDETAVERVRKYQRKVGNFWGSQRSTQIPTSITRR